MTDAEENDHAAALSHAIGDAIFAYWRQHGERVEPRPTISALMSTIGATITGNSDPKGQQLSALIDAQEAFAFLSMAVAERIGVGNLGGPTIQ